MTRWRHARRRSSSWICRIIVSDWEGQNPRLNRASGFLMVTEGMWESEMASSSCGLWCRRENTQLHSTHPDEAAEMVGNPLHETRPALRFAEPPWNEQSAPWRQIEAQLRADHLAGRVPLVRFVDQKTEPEQSLGDWSRAE